MYIAYTLTQIPHPKKIRYIKIEYKSESKDEIYMFASNSSELSTMEARTPYGFNLTSSIPPYMRSQFSIADIF